MTSSSGAHRCLGSTLTRVVWVTAMEQILTRLPDYQVDSERSQRYVSIGFFNGWNSIPVTFSPGSRLGAELPG
jgi:cytochrome P450